MVASRTRGAVRKPKREPEDHRNLLWKGTTRQQKRDLNFLLNKMYFRSIDVPKVLNWKTMETLGCDKIMADVLLVRKVTGSEFVTSQMWKRAVEIREPIYIEWCFEFFSSLRVKRDITDEEALAGTFMKFSLGGVERRVTLFEFGKLWGLYSDEEMKSGMLERLVVEGGRTGEFDGEKFWKEISGEDARIYGKRRV
jgi:hypothetical protein